MNGIKNWFANHSISTHSIVGGIAGFVGLYTTVPGVKSAVDAFVSPHPKLSIALGGLVAAVLAYKGSHSTRGQVDLIASTPPAQVAAAVTAVKAANATVAPPPVVPNMQNVVAAAAANEPVPPVVPRA